MPRTLRPALLAFSLVLLGASPAFSEVYSPPRPLQIPADANGRYHLLEREVIGRDMVRVLVRRESATSVVNYTMREIDCPKDKVRLVGDGTTEEAARQRLPNSDAWSDLFPRSINWHVMREACG